MYQKGFVNLWLIGALVVVLGVGGYFVMRQNTSSPTPVYQNQTNATQKTSQTSSIVTANWKTYSNIKYGFEVQYPSNYFEFNKLGDSRIFFRSEGCKMLIEGGGTWPTNCQAYDFVVQQNKITAEGMDLSNTSVNVAGFQGEKITTSEGMWDNMTQVLVQFQKGQNWYIQTFSFNQDKTKEADATINQILATFKFISTPASNTVVCSATEHSCPCATGNYCLFRGAMCLNPTSACPTAK
jgi:hypothetical protein